MDEDCLTKEEMKWAKRLEKALLACPPGLELVTIGDPRLVVFRRTTWDALCDQGETEPHLVDGVALHYVKSGCPIHGCAG